MFQKRWDDGIEMRTFEAGDAEALFACVDANRARLREWLPWLDYNRAVEDSRTFIGICAAQENDGKGFTAALRIGERIVGVAGFHPLDRKNRAAALGYWIGKEAEGKGLVTRAARELVRHAFEVYGSNRVEIRCATGNLRSQAVARRLGFTEEGTLRECEWLYDRFVDHRVFSMLRSEWTLKGHE